MTLDSTIDRCLNNLIGQPCWQVKPGIHPCLTLEFGVPYLEIREPRKPSRHSSEAVRKVLARRSVRVRGDYHLWTLTSSWVVHRKSRRVGDSAREESISGAAYLLDGQIVQDIAMKQRGCQTVLDFDLGGRLTITLRHDEEWMLFLPRRMVLTIRGDKHFTYHKSNSDPGTEKWRPAWTD